MKKNFLEFLTMSLRKKRKAIFLFGMFILVISVTIFTACNVSSNLSPYSKGVLTVTFIDVGQGDSIFLAMDDETMLIDTGEKEYAYKVTQFIQEKDYDRIGVLVATHPHDDHIGGMAEIIRNFTIGKMYMPDVSHTTQTFINMMDAIENKNVSRHIPLQGENFKLGKATVTVLSAGLSNYSLNNTSIVLKVELDKYAFIFTGDVEFEAERDILSAKARFDISAYVLKISHHGSDTSTSDDFLDAVKPKIAVITVGKDNRYEHPDKEVIDKLSKKGIKTYLTSKKRNITIVTDGRKMEVITTK